MVFPSLQSLAWTRFAYMLAVLIFVSVTLALCTTIVAFPRGWVVDVGTPGDVRYLNGFYQKERDGTITFRWSNPDASILPYGSHGGLALLRLRLHGDAPTSERTCSVQMLRQTQLLAHYHVSGGWRTYDILLPPSNRFTPTGEPLLLRATACQATSHDGRPLGIPVDSIYMSHITSLHTPWWGAFLRAWLLLWVILLGAALLWIINRILHPHHERLQAMRHVLIQSLGVVLLFAWWAWYAPFMLWWAWSLSLPWLIVVTVALPIGMLLVHTVRNTDVVLTFRKDAKAQRLNRFFFYAPVYGVIAFVLAHVLLLLPLPVSAQALLLWFIVVWAGALSVLALCSDERDPLVQVFLALCGGIVLPPVLLLFLQALPGTVHGWLLLLICDAITVVSARVVWKQYVRRRIQEGDNALGVQRTPTPWPFFLLLIIAAFFRFAYLGSAEFQGDEARAVIMSAAMYQGHDDVLLLHRKGPMETLLPAVPMVVTGCITELGARIPFALASGAVLIGAYVLMYHLSGSMLASLVALGIVALDGFLIGFSRMVQYQYIVLLMTFGGIWLCWRFFRGGPVRYLTLAAWFAAIGLLAHYDGIFGLPVMLCLVVAGGMRRQWTVRQWGAMLTYPLLLGGGMLASFYVPFVLHEHFDRTLTYIMTMRIGERGGNGVLFNNLEGYYLLMTMYNTIPQVWLLVGLLVVALFFWLIVYTRPRLLGVAMALLFLAGCWFVVANPQAFQVSERFNVSIAMLGLPVAVLIAISVVPVPLRIVLIWFSVPFIAETFLIADPKTHFYTMHSAVAFLIAWFLHQAVAWLRQRSLLHYLAPLILLTSVVVCISVPYTYMLFVRQYPEYARTFPSTRPTLYLADYGDDLPRGGFFGFPHRDGWKVIGELYRRGILDGPYFSNQKSLVTIWYVRDQVRGSHDAFYYFAALGEDYLFPPEGYVMYGSVFIEGNRVMDIYTREAITEEQQVFHAEDYAVSFDRREVVFPIQWELLEPAARQR